jgi:hypothetical protein
MTAGSEPVGSPPMSEKVARLAHQAFANLGGLIAGPPEMHPLMPLQAKRLPL